MASPDPMAIVTFDRVTLKRNGRYIFNNVSLTIPRHGITWLAGPSGTGKTTFLRLITGQEQPDSGTVYFDNEPVKPQQRDQLYAQRRRMGMLFQSSALFPDLTVFDNVAYPVRAHTNLSEELVRILVLLKLESVGLRGCADMMPGTLSGGMARRVALARATVMDPELIMYDEPLTGQDPISVGVLLRLMTSMQKAYQRSALVVSHQMHHMRTVADHMIVLIAGEVAGQGSPKSLFSTSNQYLAQFLHGEPDGIVPFHVACSPLEQDIAP